MNQPLKMDGYISTSTSINVAIGFMFNKIKKEDVPVLYQIIGLKKGNYTNTFFNLDTHDYTLFPEEKEILLKNGQQFKILEISEKIH